VLAPARAKDSDGWIGDTAHQQETSDHNPDETGSVPIHDADTINEVHAIDVDNDLRITVPGYADPMEGAVQHTLSRCRSGQERRLRYVIYNRRIWDYRSAWQQKPYTGPSAHTEHAHFSFSYDSALEADTSSWYFEEIIDMDLTPQNLKDIAKAVVAEMRGSLDVLSDSERNRSAGNAYGGNHPAALKPRFDGIEAKVSALAVKVDSLSIGGIDYAKLAKAVNDDAAKRMDQ
jgi:hypothetical protein